MFMRSTKAALLAGVVLAAVLAPAGAASAQQVAFHDSSADVWESVWDDEAAALEQARAGSQPNVDIVSSVVRHTGHKLILTHTFADLNRSTTRFAVVDRLRFDNGRRVMAAVTAVERWRGTPMLLRLRHDVRIKCHNLDHSIDYVTNTIVLSIPRSCIGNPKWVEVNTFAAGIQNDRDSEIGFHSYFDNGQNTSYRYGGWSRRIHQG